MSVEETRKTNLKSYKLDESALTKICKILEEESEKIKNENKKTNVDLTFEIESERKKIKVHTTKPLLDSIPKQLTHIDLSLSVDYGEKKVWIRLALAYVHSSWIEIKGNDSTWVNGIATKIEDVLEEKKTKNWIFHTFIYGLPFVMAIGTSMGSAIAFLITQFYGEWNDEEFYLHIIIYSISIIPTLGFIINWLFPKIEYEEILIQTRIRKKILWVLGMIVLGLFIAGLPKLFLSS